jgi:para-nitrobenzyl esterase
MTAERKRAPLAAPDAISRRTIVGGSSLLLAAAATGAGAAAQAPAAPSAPAAERPTAPAAALGGAASGQIFWTVETAYGKVQGIANGAIKEFKGVPYGADTGGKNRYLPPRKPRAWYGVRDCIGYGPVSPQTPADLRSDYAMMIMWDRHVGVGGMGEDCLSLNIWTPGINDHGKRPVLVSFHGGGWGTGSGNGPGYDGAQLARFGDVVVVTVNHRLASFGYLNLKDLGAPPEFAMAGVAGVMDMALSLAWVRDNIESFGGDPGRVMIFGQSGGGAKTSVLMGTPAARGLFHRAAVQSGSQLRLTAADAGAQAAEKFLAKLGVDRKNIAALQKKSWAELLVAQTNVEAAFTPVLDGTYLPHHPFDPSAPLETEAVPLIVSTTLHDAALRLTNFDLDEAGLRNVARAHFAERGDAIVDAYRKAKPGQTPFLTQAEILTDATRRNAVTQAERKAALNRAPAYLYVWDWAPSAFDGKFGAVHGIDVSASFHNARDQTLSSGAARGRAMADRLASAWVAFAKTGDPNNDKIPFWPAYDARTRATMVFDDETRVIDDYRGPQMRMLAAAMPGPAPRG